MAIPPFGEIDFMSRITVTVLAAALLAVPAAAQVAPAAAPAPLPPTAMGWTIEKDTGTCVLRKGGDREGQIALTSRGRLMLSAPDLPDANFIEGQQAQITLRWGDGRAEATEAATIVLPGGGSGNLRPRMAYIVPYDTLKLAQNAQGGVGQTNGFILGVERAGVPVWMMDTTGSGPAMKTFLECADSVMIKRVETPVVPVKKKR